MIVDFPDPDEPTSAVTVPGYARKLTSCSTGLPGSYAEADVVERELALDVGQRDRAARVFILGTLVEHFARALQSRDSLGQLRADAHDLKDRRHQERQKRRIADMNPPTVSVPSRIWCAPISMTSAPATPQQRRRREAHHRHRGQRAENVVEQALDALA